MPSCCWNTLTLVVIISSKQISSSSCNLIDDVIYGQPPHCCRHTAALLPLHRGERDCVVRAQGGAQVRGGQPQELQGGVEMETNLRVVSRWKLGRQHKDHKGLARPVMTP